MSSIESSAPGRAAAASSSLQLLAAAQDDGEEVVEVVGHPAGEPPDALQLLGLLELLPEAVPLGDVPVVDDDPRDARGVEEVPEPRLHQRVGPVGAADPDLDPAGRAGSGQDLGHRPLRPGMIVGVDVVEHRAVVELLG